MSGVDENQRVVAVEQLVGEMNAADAEVGDGDIVGKALFAQPARDLDAEAVVTEEDVTHAGDKNFAAHITLVVALLRRD